MFGREVRLGIIRKSAACNFECRRMQQILAVNFNFITFAFSFHRAKMTVRDVGLKKRMLEHQSERIGIMLRQLRDNVKYICRYV